MSITIQEHVESDGIGMIRIEGEIELNTAPEVQATILRQIERGISRLAINLEAVVYLDSVGLGSLLSGLQRARERGGELVVICTNGQVLRVFDITGLDAVFEIVPTEAQAITRLSAMPAG